MEERKDRKKTQGPKGEPNNTPVPSQSHQKVKANKREDIKNCNKPKTRNAQLHKEGKYKGT